jgi:hypothetical protein
MSFRWNYVYSSWQTRYKLIPKVTNVKLRETLTSWKSPSKLIPKLNANSNLVTKNLPFWLLAKKQRIIVNQKPQIWHFSVRLLEKDKNFHLKFVRKYFKQAKLNITRLRWKNFLNHFWLNISPELDGFFGVWSSI